MKNKHTAKKHLVNRHSALKQLGKKSRKKKLGNENCLSYRAANREQRAVKGARILTLKLEDLRFSVLPKRVLFN